MSRDSELISRAERLLADSLGQGLVVRRVNEPAGEPGNLRADAILTVSAPDGSNARQVVEARQSVFPRDVRGWLRGLRPAPSGSSYLLVSRFLSPRTRSLLQDAGVNYVDMTGNMLVRIERPSIFILREGAAKDPAPLDATAKSLRGAKAARVVRSLCDYREPATSRAVAERAGVTPG